MFDVTLEIYKEDLACIKVMPAGYKRGLLAGTRRAMFFVEGKAKRRFDTPGNLKVRSGHYRRSIRSGVDSKHSGVMGFLSANIPYASIHEYGGTIYPKKGKYLRFPIAGKWVTVRKVVIPARPLITPAIEENLPKIGEIIVEDIIKETGGE